MLTGVMAANGINILGAQIYTRSNGTALDILHVNKPVEFLVKKAAGHIPHDIVVKAPEAGMDFKVELSDTFQPIKFTPTKIVISSISTHCFGHIN